MKGHTMKGHRCQWHDLVCDKELESCIECERFPDNEGKPNFTAEPMQALRECSYGVTITVCPACHEPAYEEGRCVSHGDGPRHFINTYNCSKCGAVITAKFKRR